MINSADIIHRKNLKLTSPDQLEFKHPLSEEWFKALSVCSLDYYRTFLERFVTREENSDAS